MDIACEVTDGVSIVSIEGSLETATVLKAESFLMGKIDEGARRILIDFSKLDYLNSAGLRVLLITAKKLSSKEGELRLCSLNETVQEMFDISGFSMLLKVFENRPTALEGFS